MISIWLFLPKLDTPRCGLGLFDPVPRKTNSIVKEKTKNNVAISKTYVCDVNSEKKKIYLIYERLRQKLWLSDTFHVA